MCPSAMSIFSNMVLVKNQALMMKPGPQHLIAGQ
jgi:hypothetical protein